MSLIKEEVVLKEKPKTTHPWQNTLKSEYQEKAKYAHNSIKNPQYPKKKQVSHMGGVQFEVIGNRFSKEFIYCANLLKGLHKYKSKYFACPKIKGVNGVEWQNALYDIRLRFGGESYCQQNCQVIILHNGKYFGGHKELKEYIEKRYVYNLGLNYHKEAIAEFCNFISSSRRPFAYLHFNINKKEIGPMIFMLYSELVPNTCNNFMRLCKERRGGYPGSPVHRIVKEGWIQCGGFGLKAEPELGCENFIVPHDKRGVLAMCNDGSNVDCSTQFFVLLQPAKWMEHKYVAFGQLVEGEGVLSQIEDTPTWNETPTKDIIITKAGVLNLDCTFRMINKSTQLYLDRHTEDLVSLGELLMETLMLSVFAQIDANKAEESSQSSYEEVEMEVSEEFIKKDEKKEVKESTQPTETDSSKIKEKRPYYLAFTNVPYPEEYDSDFDTKRFLQGHYCLENDLTIDLPKDEKQHTRIVIPTTVILSEMNLCDELKGPGAFDDEGLPDMDSSEEEELRNYIKDNVERASFAGGVIRNICKGVAMPNLFEGARKSEMVNEDDVKKLRMQFQRRASAYDRRQSMAARKSEVISDETVRKLRRFSMFERRVSQAARKSEVPGLDIEKLNKLAEQRDQQALEEKRLQEEHEKKPKAGKKASLGFALPDGDKSSSAEDDDDDDEEGFKKRAERTVSLVPQTRGKTISKIMRRPTGYLRQQDIAEILKNKKIKLAAMGEQVDEMDDEEFEYTPPTPEPTTFPSRFDEDDKQMKKLGASEDDSTLQYRDHDSTLKASKHADSALPSSKHADSTFTSSEHGDSALASRKHDDSALTSSKHGDSAFTSSKHADSAFTSSKKADGALTSSKHGDDALTSSEHADSALTSSKYADSALTTSKHVDGALTSSEHGDSALISSKHADGALTSSKHTDSALTSSKHGDSALTSSEHADGALTSSKHADSALTSSKHADGAFTSSKHADGTFTSSKHADGAFTSSKHADGALTSSKHGDSALTLSKHADGALKSSKHADGAFTSSKHADGAFTSSKHADGTFTSSKHADGSFTSSKHGDGALTSSKHVDGALTSSKHGDSALTLSKHADGALKSSKHSDGAFTSSKYADSALTSSKHADGALTSSKHGDGALTSSKHADGALTSSKHADSGLTSSEHESALEMEQNSVLDPYSDPLFEKMIEMFAHEPDAALPTLKNYKSLEGPNFFLSGILQRTSKRIRISYDEAPDMSSKNKIKGDVDINLDKGRRGKRRLSLSHRPLDDYKITKYTLTVEEYKKKNLENRRKLKAEAVN